MTQAIFVYISKAILGLAQMLITLESLLNLEQQNYVTIWNKTTTTQIVGVSHLFLHIVENLWSI